jgi:hypothetical protein
MKVCFAAGQTVDMEQENFSKPSFPHPSITEEHCAEMQNDKVVQLTLLSFFSPSSHETIILAHSPPHPFFTFQLHSSCTSEHACSPSLRSFVQPSTQMLRIRQTLSF